MKVTIEVSDEQITELRAIAGKDMAFASSVVLVQSAFDAVFDELGEAFMEEIKAN